MSELDVKTRLRNFSSALESVLFCRDYTWFLLHIELCGCGQTLSGLSPVIRELNGAFSNPVDELYVSEVCWKKWNGDNRSPDMRGSSDCCWQFIFPVKIS